MVFNMGPLDWESSTLTTKSSRLEFLEKSSANNFALSDAKNNTAGPLSRGVISDLPFLRKFS